MQTVGRENCFRSKGGRKAFHCWKLSQLTFRLKEYRLKSSSRAGPKGHGRGLSKCWSTTGSSASASSKMPGALLENQAMSV